jgi:hypothetical protein
MLAVASDKAADPDAALADQPGDTDLGLARESASRVCGRGIRPGQPEAPCRVS